MGLIAAIKEGNTLEVKQLINSGANLCEVDEEGDSSFLLAIKYGMPLEIIELFVAKGVDPLGLTPEGVGAIDIAIEVKRLEVVKYLHQMGLDLNEAKRDSMMTPLMIAACYNRVDIAKYLVLQDVDSEKKDRSGLRALDYARKLGQKEVYQFLQQL